MSFIVPTVDLIGDEALTNSIIDRSITELQDNIITTLPNNAMQYCKALKKVVFGAASSVGMLAFSNCTSLETADFYEAFTLQTRLFISCGALKALILRGRTVSALANTNAFEKSGIASGTGYIYVPAALVDSYKTAANWSTYANQIRAIEDYPEVCDPYSWEAVSKAIDNGTYKDVYKIGDTVPVDLGSEGVINMQIAAFDADTLADGSGTAAISWVAKELLRSMSWGSSSGGWNGSIVRSYFTNTVKPLLPTNLSSIIETVSKKSYDVGANNITEDDLWAPSWYEEVRGSATSKYRKLFPDGPSRIKYYGNSTKKWWTRDAYSSSAVKAVSTSGFDDNTTYSNAAHTCLGFCTGKSK